jgi:hypothetical protein
MSRNYFFTFVVLNIVCFVSLYRQYSVVGQQGKSCSPPHMFDTIQERLYKTASTHVDKDRKEFTLSSWNRGSGGLDDSDRMLLGELYYNANSVFEFGLGESTKIAAYVGVPRYAGVDSDAVWVKKARGDSKMDHFRFTFADIGDTVEFGNPKNDKLQKIPYNYQIAPLIVEMDAFDVYLVDGRYRVSSACVSMLHAMRHGGNMSKVMVAIHDNHRETYQQFNKVADVVKKSNKLSVFRLKQDITEDDIFKVWEKNTWDRGRR